MSKVKVTIKCKQVMHFNQDVELSVEDYEKIKDLNFDDIDERHNLTQYSILASCLNFNDVFDNDSEFTDVDVRVVSDK